MGTLLGHEGKKDAKQGQRIFLSKRQDSHWSIVPEDL